MDAKTEEAMRGLDGIAGYTKLHMTSCCGDGKRGCTCWEDRFKVIAARVRSIKAILSEPVESN